MISSILKDCRVLVVEDDFLIALDLTATLEAAQAIVLGPASRVGDGLELMAREQTISAAVLDVSLFDETVFPVADALQERGIPFLFATGEHPDKIPRRFADILICRKPVQADALIHSLSDLLFPGWKAPNASSSTD